jgi:hypothetical protein
MAARERRNEVIDNLVDVRDLNRQAAARYARMPLGLSSSRRLWGSRTPASRSFGTRQAA